MHNMQIWACTELQFQKYVKFMKQTDALQSSTGKYRGLQGNPCNENRITAMRIGFPVMKTGFFHVRIVLQGVPCKP